VGVVALEELRCLRRLRPPSRYEGPSEGALNFSLERFIFSEEERKEKYKIILQSLLPDATEYGVA
jgi:hypothetical protein